MDFDFTKIAINIYQIHYFQDVSAKMRIYNLD